MNLSETEFILLCLKTKFILQMQGKHLLMGNDSVLKTELVRCFDADVNSKHLITVKARLAVFNLMKIRNV